MHNGGMTTVGTGRVGTGPLSPSRKIDEQTSFSNLALADGVKIVLPMLFLKPLMSFSTDSDACG